MLTVLDDSLNLPILQGVLPAALAEHFVFANLNLKNIAGNNKQTIL